MDRCVQKDRSICFLFIVERWLVDWLGGREIGILKFYISSVFVPSLTEEVESILFWSWAKLEKCFQLRASLVQDLTEATRAFPLFSFSFFFLFGACVSVNSVELKNT